MQLSQTTGDSTAPGEKLHRHTPACSHCGKAMRLPLGSLPQLITCAACGNPVLFTEVDSPPLAAPGYGDIRAEALEGTVLERMLAAIPARLDTLPVLPGVFQQVLSLIHDPISDMNDIVTAVERDTTLTLHLLKIANSAMYRGTTPVDDARTACVRLGMKEIATVVWRVQCASAFRSTRQDLNDMMNSIWNMSVASGYCARAVARMTQGPPPEMAFLAGLTHAVGHTLLVQILATETDFAIQRIRDREDRYRQLIARHGPLMGVRVLEHWGTPPALRVSTLYQRAPHLAPSPELARLAHVLALGIELARLCGFSLEEDTTADANRVQASCLALGFTPAQLPELARSLQADVEDLVGAMALG
jgi:HD-like signal output (HDOD) protein